MTFSATLMNLETIILSEVIQAKTNITDITYRQNLKRNKIQIKSFIKDNRLMDLENKLLFTRVGKMVEKDRLGILD